MYATVPFSFSPSSSLSRSTLSLRFYPERNWLCNVFLLSDRVIPFDFITFDLISSSFEFIFIRSCLVGINFLSCIIDEENGFKDFLVTILYLVLIGLILNLPFSENKPSYDYFSSKVWPLTLVINLIIKLLG